MKPAIIVVDMLKDNFRESSRNPYYETARTIIPNLQKVLGESRERGFLIVFACDSFLEGDLSRQDESSFPSGNEGCRGHR